MDIGSIISEYIELKPFGEDFVGRCPFCLSHRRLLVVIPHLKNYECLSCGLRGGAVDFIKRMESIIDREFHIRQKWAVRSPQIGTVYVLSLEGGHFYIGFTHNLPHRLSQHFDQRGALWTQKFRPLKLVDVYYDVPEFVEHRVTKRYIERFGSAMVRGGWYLDAREIPGPYFGYPKKLPYRHKPKKLGTAA